MSFLRHIIREAHRRSLWQVLGVYLALAWGVYQVIKELTEFAGLPDWVPGFAVVLLLIGLPIVLATAFIQEGAPGRRSEPAEPADPTLLPMLDLPETAPSQPAPRHHALFTWQKAVLGGVAAFLLLGITAGGYMGMRNAGVGPFGSLLASGELDARQPILIAEFTPLNGDTMLATTVTEAFRVDFAQSPTITVLERKHVRTVLQRMSRDPDTRVDADLAHEIATRDNIKAYLTGEVSQAGSRYVVAGKLIATRDERVLATYRETANSEDDVIEAVDRLSKRLRGKIGESLKTIRADKPLELVSTPSMEALQKYTQGLYAVDVERDFDKGISLLQEAIALDSAFAMAWRKLGVAYANSDGSEYQRRTAIKKAYDFRDRLTDVERYNAMGMYYYSLKGDNAKAQNAYEMLMDRDPTWPPNNLGIIYMRQRNYEKAAETYRRTIEIDSTLSSAYINLVDAYIEMNDRKQAEEALAVVRRKFGDVAFTAQAELFLLSGFRDHERFTEVLRKQLASGESNAMWRSRMSHHAADAAFIRGRIREAERQRARAVAADVERGHQHLALQSQIWRAAVAYLAERNPARAAQILDDALAKYPLEQLQPLDRPYRELAGSFAMLGQVPRARQFLAEFERLVPPDMRHIVETENLFFRGAVALSEKRPDEAISAWRKLSEQGICRMCMDVELSLAFEQAGQPDSAIARLERYANTPTSRAIWEDANKLGYTYERLADLHAARGNTERAVHYAGMFVSLWQDADAELQPRVRAKRAMLQQLRRT